MLARQGTVLEEMNSPEQSNESDSFPEKSSLLEVLLARGVPVTACW